MKKTELSAKDILHLANLANLKLSQEEEKKIEKQFTETLDYIQNLSELNTENTLPTNHVVNLQNEFFKDGKMNTRALSEKEVFGKTKARKNKYFSVDKIL